MGEYKLLLKINNRQRLKNKTTKRQVLFKICVKIAVKCILKLNFLCENTL